jgi:hypothetical protein
MGAMERTPRFARLRRRALRRSGPALLLGAVFTITIVCAACSGSTGSPNLGAVSSSSPTASAGSSGSPTTSTVSAQDLGAAKAVVRKIVAAVNGNRFARARSLLVDPDKHWSLDDMKAIRWVRLRHVALLRIAGPHAVWLSTDLRRQPPPIAGGPDWPNFMLVVRDPSGAWKVAQTATGP